MLEFSHCGKQVVSYRKVLSHYYVAAFVIIMFICLNDACVLDLKYFLECSRVVSVPV